ncbi:hypothetical protein ABEY26_11310, partial [Bacillus rhizoplanae]
QGETGPAGPAEMTIYLATDQSINTSQSHFMGLGTSSGGMKGFERNNVVIPQTATITGLVFSIRDDDLRVGSKVTAEIFISGGCASNQTNTGIKVTLEGTGQSHPDTPNTNCYGFVSVSVANGYSVHQCDLLSVRVTIEGSGALENGAAATVLLTI